MKIDIYARYIGAKADDVETDGDIFYTGENRNRMYVLSRDEVREKELDTFESCYYGEYKRYFCEALEKVFEGRKDAISLSSQIVNGMVLDVEAAFVATGYESESLKNYKLYGGFYFESE